MRTRPILVGALVVLMMGASATANKNKDPWDLGDAFTVPVRECIDGCLRDDDGHAIMHFHFIVTCDLCGTSNDVLIFKAYDDKGVLWTYAAMFPNHQATSSARSRRNIDTMVTEFSLRECLRGCSRFGHSPSVEWGPAP